MNANEWAEMTKLTSEVMKLIEKNRQQQAEIEALKADKALHDEAYLSQMKEIEALKAQLFKFNPSFKWRIK